MLSRRDSLILFYLFEFEQNVRNTRDIGISRISNQETKRREIFTSSFLKLTIGMEKILKQVCATDVAQKELVVTLGRLFDDLTHELYSRRTFPNTKKGFLTLLQWVKKLTNDQTVVRFVMEATGVYHESLAYFLDSAGCEVSIVLPNKISNYMRTLDVKTITDKTASDAIARFGLERSLQRWQRPNPVFKKLRQLTREREQVIQIRSMTKNQLHAEQAEAEPNEGSVARIKKHIAFLNKQVKELNAEIKTLSMQDEKVKGSMKVICSVTGVGLITAANALGETNGFDLIRNKRQITSYAGYDVVEKQSGTSVKGKTKISKKGNKYLRKAMHMPALSAIRHDERFKAMYARLISKHGIKMKAAVAVQRKLLEMIYTAYKTNTPYDKNYLQRKNNTNQLEESRAVI
jgi:transposase